MGINVSFMSSQGVEVEHRTTGVDGDNAVGRFRGIVRGYSSIFLITIKVSHLLFLRPSVSSAAPLVVHGDDDAEHDEDDDTDYEADNEVGGRSSGRVSAHVNWI